MNPTKTNNWKKLINHFETIKNKQITDCFNKKRLNDFSFEFNHIYFDYTKHRIDRKMLDIFSDFAKEMDLTKGIETLFSGDIINHTEKRAVLHTALRQQNKKPIYVDNKNVIPEVNNALEKIKHFSNNIIKGNWKGITEKSITDIVNIGIGGSDLGPKMIVEALSDYKNHLQLHYLSNIDPFELDNIIGKVNLETTLFIVVSKSFSTQETLTNAKVIQEIYIEKYGKKSIAKHFATVSTQIEKAKEFGIHKNNIFPMWDWVGGRYSLWSPAGISIPLAIGFNNFKKLLEGAHKMDIHFKETNFDKNLPVITAFLTILYNNFYKFESEAFIPYAEKLKYLPAFLQQLIMESNGKTIDNQENRINYETGNIVWGNTGTNSQHSFFQLLHQGNKIIPINFIAEKNNSSTKHKNNHLILLSNMIAQAEALMIGDKNHNPYKNFKGNRPSTTILLDEITPETLGSLIAYFEHKTFVEGYLWNINSFDQFGVELGKKLAKNVLKELKNKKVSQNHDISTNQLIKKIF